MTQLHRNFFGFLFFLFITFLSLKSQNFPVNLERVSNANENTGNCIPELFYEVDGFVCMEAENAKLINHYNRTSGETGIVMQALKEGTGKGGGILSFKIKFKNAGNYAIWILARKDKNQGHNNGNKVLVLLDRKNNSGTYEGDFLVDINFKKSMHKDYGTSIISFGENYISRWFCNTGNDAIIPLYWQVKEPGVHKFELATGKEYGFGIKFYKTETKIFSEAFSKTGT